MAYTKYSLTPADNNAAPPNGAPEGMLPSAVNDTMRDMMSQIRDVGDGIRGGTYTMTAPVITGGSITGVALSGNTLTNPVISGGSINNTPIGASTANTGAFTNLAVYNTSTSQFRVGFSDLFAWDISRDNVATGALVFRNASDSAFTERMRMPAAGGVQSVGSISVGNATPTTSGAGITFPATQSPSTNANTLDDYEEGTWTPAVARTGSSYSFVQQLGSYVKIGRQVTVNCYLQVGSVTTQGSGYITITGFPFTASIRGVGAVSYNNIAQTKNARSAAIFPNENFSYLIESIRTDDAMQDTVGAGYLGFTLTYFV